MWKITFTYSFIDIILPTKHFIDIIPPTKHWHLLAFLLLYSVMAVIVLERKSTNFE
jgi:hypothetical protein